MSWKNILRFSLPQPTTILKFAAPFTQQSSLYKLCCRVALLHIRPMVHTWCSGALFPAHIISEFSQHCTFSSTISVEVLGGRDVRRAVPEARTIVENYADQALLVSAWMVFSWLYETSLTSLLSSSDSWAFQLRTPFCFQSPGSGVINLEVMSWREATLNREWHHCDAGPLPCLLRSGGTSG